MYYGPKRTFGDPKPDKKEKPKYNLKQFQAKKAKPTGEKALFEEIWEERPWVCVNCKDPIHYFSVSNFDHILTKKQRPDLRLDKNNIRILCHRCHMSRHNDTEDKFNSYKKLWWGLILKIWFLKRFSIGDFFRGL